MFSHGWTVESAWAGILRKLAALQRSAHASLFVLFMALGASKSLDSLGGSLLCEVLSLVSASIFCTQCSRVPETAPHLPGLASLYPNSLSLPRTEGLVMF